MVIKIPDCQYDLLLPEQDEERFFLLLPNNPLPLLPHPSSLSLPFSFPFFFFFCRVIILGAISKLCSAWLETAMAKAPLEVGSLLQEYVQSYRYLFFLFLFLFLCFFAFFVFFVSLFSLFFSFFSPSLSFSLLGQSPNPLEPLLLLPLT